MASHNILSRKDVYWHTGLRHPGLQVWLDPGAQMLVPGFFLCTGLPLDGFILGQVLP